MHLHSMHTYTCANIHIHAFTYISFTCMYTYTCTYVYTHTYRRTYAHTCTCTSAHIYIYIYIHTEMHAGRRVRARVRAGRQRHTHTHMCIFAYFIDKYVCTYSCACVRIRHLSASAILRFRISFHRVCCSGFARQASTTPSAWMLHVQLSCWTDVSQPGGVLCVEQLLILLAFATERIYL